MGAKHDTAASPMRSTNRALSGPPGTFLAPGLATAAANFAAGLGLMRTQPLIGKLANQCLMHHSRIDFCGKDSVRQFNRTDLLALHIPQRYLHRF